MASNDYKYMHIYIAFFLGAQLLTTPSITLGFNYLSRKSLMSTANAASKDLIEALQ